ncbi:MAG: Kae1-associated kinase Bud32 [Candidatus Hydrothermarchaeota archaeon]|nr:MAG: Kae1-associated kinase Bud32 [Candidatus Hydrothermarchaeota archaeon]
MKLIAKGAEANLYLKNGSIIKERVPKGYRAKELDEFLRKTRTKREAKLISLARRCGVPTPFIRDVDLTKMAIEIEYIKGEKVKNLLSFRRKDRKERRKICEEIGKLVAKLHANNIIHGDLTTSNMIFSEGKIFFIDFGLGEINEAIEAKGVDLLVFKKTLHSTHYEYEEDCWNAFVEGYSQEYDKAKEVLHRLRVIEKRGRYFAERE